MTNGNFVSGAPTDAQIEREVASATGWDSSNDLIKHAFDHLGRPRTKEGDELTRVLVVRLAEGLRAALNAAGAAPQEPGWSTADRRSAEAEARSRWPIEGAQDRVTERDQIIFQQGCINGFMLGAEWWKALTAAGAAPVTPSEATATSEEDQRAELRYLRAELAAAQSAAKPSQELTNAEILERIAERERESAGAPAPTPDREKLIADADELIQSWDARGSWTPDSPIGMIMQLRAALAASPVVDEAKIAVGDYSAGVSNPLDDSVDIAELARLLREHWADPQVGFNNICRCGARFEFSHELAEHQVRVVVEALGGGR